MRASQRRSFGEILREARTIAGRSLDQVAKHLGITIAYLSDIERNRRAPLSQDKIHAVAEFLNADLVLLLQSAARARGAIDVRNYTDSEFDSLNELASLPRGRKRDQLAKEIQALIEKSKEEGV